MKKKFILVFSAMLAASSVWCREVASINRDWLFHLGDIRGSENVVWQHVGLPHSFSLPYFMSKDFYVGYGWYKKTIRLSRKDLQQYLALEFDGVFQEAEIYVNGKLAGRHVGGYTGFEISINPYVRAGDNLITIRVNNLWKATVAPRGGEHTFSGGIYRNVRLVKKSVAHIAWYGTRITTPTLEASNGKASTVNVETELQGLMPNKPYVLEAVVSHAGHIVSQNKVAVMCSSAADRHTSVNVSTPDIPHPLLWSPSCPNLYTLTTRLYDGKELIDENTETFGFRWFTWTTDRGFFINGQHLFFHGANVHQDQAGWGDGVTDEASRRDVRMMRQCGFDMIRGSHYPHSPAFSDECDRQGMLLWEEAPFWGTAGEKKDGYWTASAYPEKKEQQEAFEQNVLQQLEEMIRIHRNHPSIFIWSMCNEAFFTSGNTMPGVRHLLKRMVDRVHQLDPTRKTAIGGAQRPLGQDRIDLIGDVAGYNGDGATIADFQQPSVPSVVTEYGSTTATRPGRFIPGWGDLSRDDGYKGKPWRCGQAIWCGFDHGSIFGDALGRMGIVDYFRLPKRSWYWYRQAYKGVDPPDWPTTGIPAALSIEAVAPKGGIRTDGTEDAQIIITVMDKNGKALSNSPDVTLRIVSGPGEFPTGRSISFSRNSDIQILDGKAAIALRAYQQGNTIIEASSPGLKSARMTLHFVGGPRFRRDKQVNDTMLARPYVRFTRNQADALQSFGKDNPIFSSSAAQGHPAGMATDGNKNTYWETSPTGEKSYLTLDTERSIILHEIQIATNAQKDAFHLDLSNDNEHWIESMYSIEGSEDGWHIHLATPSTCRYIRLTFTKPNIKVYEMEAKGVLSK